MVCFILVRILRNLYETLLEIWLNQQIDSRACATILSMYGQIDSVGQIVGGPLIGLLVTIRSLRTGLAVTGITLAALAGVFTRTLKLTLAHDPSAEKDRCRNNQ